MSVKRKAFGAAAALCVLLGVSAAAIALPKASKASKASKETTKPAQEVMAQTTEQTPDQNVETPMVQTPSASSDVSRYTEPLTVSAVNKSIRALREKALENERAEALKAAKRYADAFLKSELKSCDQDSLLPLSDAYAAFVDKLSDGSESKKKSIINSFAAEYRTPNIEYRSLEVFDIVSEWYKYNNKGLLLHRFENTKSELMPSSQIEDALNLLKGRFDALFGGMYDTSGIAGKYGKALGVRVTLQYSGGMFDDQMSEYTGCMTLDLIKYEGSFKVINHMDYLSEGTVVPSEDGIPVENTEQLSTTQTNKTE